MNLEGRREAQNVNDVRKPSKRNLNADIDNAIRKIRQKGNPDMQYNEVVDKVNDSIGWDKPWERMKYADELKYLREDKAWDSLDKEAKERKTNPSAEPEKKDKTNVHIGRRRNLNGDVVGEYRMK